MTAGGNPAPGAGCADCASITTAMSVRPPSKDLPKPLYGTTAEAGALILLALSITHIYTVEPCVTASEKGGRWFHRASPEVGVVAEVEARYWTEPYCAVKEVLANWMTPFDRVPKVKAQVGPCVTVETSTPKLLLTVGVMVFTSWRY